MAKMTTDLITRIGETDQLYLEQNTPELALERADLRLQLVALSNIRQEQIHFLQEGIVLLEQGRLSFEEMPMSLYIELSLHLAKAYMMFYELTHEDKYALITKQILKPLTVHEDADVFFLLSYASIMKKELAMTRHWLTKYAKTAEFDVTLLKQHHAFEAVRHEDWFAKLIETKLH